MSRTLPAAFLLASSALAVPPATLQQQVTYNGQTVTMQLTKLNLRGSNFELKVQNSSGGYTTVTPVAERSYMGTVDEYPGAVSCGILKDNGDFLGTVYFDRGATWFTLNGSVTGTRGLEYAVDAFHGFTLPTADLPAAGQGGNQTYRFDVGIDASYDYYTQQGSVASCVEMIEYSVNNVRAIYIRDALLRPALGRVIIRGDATKDPYSQSMELSGVKSEWEQNQTSALRDVVCGIDPAFNGGLAWVGAIGGTTAHYSANNAGGDGSFDVTWRHELGHNWSCPHFVGGSPEGKGIMGGNGPGRFSGCEVRKILDYRANRISAGGILDNEGTFTAVDFPPYAAMDTARCVVNQSVTFNVKVNDFDANGDTFSLSTFDSTSAKGGTVTQSGQNLVYTAPGSSLGTDYFLYTIVDSSGQTATGVVVIDVRANDPLVMYLPLDETTGTVATDLSANANNGTQAGNPTWTTGKFGNALTLDGNDYLMINGVAGEITSNNITLSAWVKTTDSEADWFSCNTSSGGNVFMFSIHGGKASVYDGSYEASSTTTVNNNAWHLLTYVRNGSTGSIYVDGNLEATHTANFTLSSTDLWSIGQEWDNTTASDFLIGSVDDVRLYNKALTATEVDYLVQGGNAEVPLPFDTQTGVKAGLFNWEPAANMTSQNFYLGTSLTAVTNAGTSSAEYRGSVTGSEWSGNLQPNTTYYWRVDSLASGITRKGSIWTFSTGAAQSPSGLWNFPTSNPVSATLGSNLVLTGSQTTVAGSVSGDQAVQIGNGSHYTVTNPIGANGGGSHTNEYTLLYDFKPTLSAGYASMIDHKDANSDGELFTRSDGSIGSQQLGYAPAGTLTTSWTRLVLRVKNDWFAELWINGVHVYDFDTQEADSRYSLLSSFDLFQDGPSGGEEETIQLSTFALWGRALDDVEIAAMGSPGAPVILLGN
ncbi:hypothetical protein KBB96_01800 [Luteolibacter ambystomatis]|uniref:Staphylococcus aureus surface protein A n=1 Tax=Luteolibacter ambystomatis TaxID=2824561 RepID=A0A975PET7_9BACT|nr:LamG-like jellyroll fold domain-containing protein [Luteolibacter ambystomatis]QUE51639.1 hypothetical protein KBB96_01800 [Luteolibacter ambystomatis]